jgi:hypothetical protein
MKPTNHPPLITVEKRQLHTNNDDFLSVFYDIEIEEYNQGEFGCETIIGITEEAARWLYKYLGEALNQKGGRP